MSDHRNKTRFGDPPIGLTAFVGRQPQILEISQRLADTRLVTLVGTGGVGKTRLAQQVALRSRRTVTVRWVQLTDLDRTTDAAMLEQAVAHACGIRDFSADTPWDALVDRLTESRHLLILDNAEHLVESVGALVSDLLAAVPTLHILVTSRQLLGCDGEQQIHVPPLTDHEAWELLADRAAAVGVTLDDHDRAHGVRLCRRLDGIPLVIELAVPRLRVMSLDELLDAADDRLRLFTGGPRHGGHPTHISLRAMVAWSWDLCSTAEQTLWARCSVFPEGAGWDLAAASHICTDRTRDDSVDRVRRSLLDQPIHHDEATLSTIEGQDVLTVLDGLVDKHIIVTDTHSTHTCYRLLATFRLFGQDVLHQRGEDAVLRQRHGHYYCTRTRYAARTWFSPDEVKWLSWAQDSLPNLRAAYEVALGNPDHAVEGLQFATDLARLRTWFFLGSPREGIAWLERGLAAVAAAHPTLTDEQINHVVAGHTTVGWIALWQGRSVESSLAACRTMLGRGPTPPAVTFLEGAALLLRHGDPRSIALLATAREGFAAAGPDYRGDTHMAELTEATAAAFLGTDDQALDATQRCLDHALAAGAPSAISWAGLVRAMALTWHGDPDQAITLLRHVLSWAQATDYRWWGTIWANHTLVWALAEQLHHSDNPTDAATIAYLLGGVDRSRRRANITLAGLAPFARAAAQAEVTVHAVLNSATYAAAYDRGAADAPAAIVATALGEQHPTRRPSLDTHAPQPWDVLTPAEQQVARLAAQGLSNPEIAERRQVSPRTVETQMSAILRRLGITNRQQLTRIISANGTRDTQA
jgi:predicted ATPase/DNA-binding CsgD family transcriptional regulator